jgi:hypothetical protein
VSEIRVSGLLVVCCGFIRDFRGRFRAGLADGLTWVVGLFVVSGCLVNCHSLDLFSVEGLVVRYMSYLRCTRLRGCSWESASLVWMDEILVDFARDDNGFSAISLCSGWV